MRLVSFVIDTGGIAYVNPERVAYIRRATPPYSDHTLIVIADGDPLITEEDLESVRRKLIDQD